ncbi:YbhB/YbcL family Raf kinase inhibitor-like protein [Sphingomonas sp. SM33]|uniref:YbhB/YbcL family Raf kinase inhibitor-like protein n=1 Tax=Sphingomonas telluris TaxID=2907998 RepID=A0ABS9VMH7_9SPHN|nr:YbhB/YbcL family Raf kinase inhibitor-like protein [Sphingomonas telluris]MCH8616177.1 YbhB/YbcL family Raf kinase inhibitor-like protein [Sphingomonas telluris]
MLRALIPLLLCSALTSCGATNEQPAKSAPNFTISSTAFADGAAIPAQFTCDGAGQAPSLRWTDPPQGTKSLALIVDDPDAPGATFGHWGAFNIPADTRSLNGSFAQAVNDFGQPGYGPPCPPKGNGVHHYRFRLLALSVDRLGLSNPKVRQLEAEAAKHAIGEARLTGVYERN